MEAPNSSELVVKALNPDNRREVENLCDLFRRDGVPLGYPSTLTASRTWGVINPRATSLFAGSPSIAHGHLALRRTFSALNTSGFDTEIILPVGDTSKIVSMLTTSRVVKESRTISFLGPRPIFETGGFRNLDLRVSASLSGSAWIYALTPSKERSKKAMAVFVPDNIAATCEECFAELGLARKRKHLTDSTQWAISADMGAFTAVDRKAGVFAVNPSLLRERRFPENPPTCMLVNVFDPAAESFIRESFDRGYEFSGVAPRLGGIDYAVLSRTSSDSAQKLKSASATPHKREWLKTRRI